MSPRALLIAILIAGAVGMAIAINLADPFGWRAGKLAKARQAEAVAEGRATVATAQSAAAADAAAITDTARARDTQTIIIHERNADAIRTAPGAKAPLDPDLLRAARRGLCNHAAYAGDPGCAEMRPAGPAELPGAGSAGSAATP
jgi:lactate dehydrogenase-like 2-hydroxyacid dehydrogenase